MKTLHATLALLASCALLAACGAPAPAPSAPSAAAGPAAAAEHVGHADHADHSGPSKAAATPSGVKAVGEATVGDRTTCPVSGEEFVVEPSSPKVAFEGKTYYLCCSGCAKKFEADPRKYLSKPKG